MPKLTMPKWWLVAPAVGLQVLVFVMGGWVALLVSVGGAVVVGVGHARSLKRRERRWELQRLCTCPPPPEPGEEDDGLALPSVCVLHGVRRGDPRH